MRSGMSGERRNGVVLGWGIWLFGCAQSLNRGAVKPRDPDGAPSPRGRGRVLDVDVSKTRSGRSSGERMLPDMAPTPRRIANGQGPPPRGFAHPTAGIGAPL